MIWESPEWKNVKSAAAQRLVKDECTLAVKCRCGEWRWECFVSSRRSVGWAGRMRWSSRKTREETLRQNEVNTMLRSNLCQKTLFNPVASRGMHCVVHCLDSSEVSVSGSCAKYSQCPPAAIWNLKHLLCGPNNVCQCNCWVHTRSALTINTETKCSAIFHSTGLEDFAQHPSRRLTASQSAHRVEWSVMWNKIQRTNPTS